MVRTLLLFVALLLPISANAQYGWADRPANLTLYEFLDLSFKAELGSPETDALNSFRLVFFFPASSPAKSQVVVTQAWRDERVSEPNLRREIRKMADGIFAMFEAMLRLPSIEKRWSPSNPAMHLVIRHARHSDVRETLGVTFKGKTDFTPEAVLEAKKAVESAGGVWSW